MRKRLTVLTVGCKANFADSASVVREAASAGFEIVPPGRPADVVVVNSCTVTHRADRDSRALVRRARREHPRAAIVLAGCYAQASPGARETLPEADRWIADVGALAGFLREIGGGAPNDAAPLSDYGADLLLGHRRTFLKIQDGCDSSCAYCVVPKARGSNRSVAEREILDNAAAAERDGARELVLTGIHIGSYGVDRGEKEALPRLVGRLLEETSAARIRLSSIEPLEVTDRLLELLGGNARVCPHLHVPLQSGCDATLARMRRPYRAAVYAEIVRRAASRVENVQIGADVIAGFPGESDADFEETVRFLSQVPVNYLHAFSYSPRHGTESAGWKDDVPAREKKTRVSRLLRLDGAKREEFLRAQVGRRLRVLAESTGPNAGELCGYSENYVRVTFPGEGAGIGEIVTVRAASACGDGLSATREGGSG